MSTKILCVDDEENVLAGLQRSLRKEFSVDVAVGGTAGLAAIDATGPYAVVVADMQMPGMNGIEFLKQVEVKAPSSIRIMLTGNADQKTAMDAVNDGHVFRFLTKPCLPEHMAAALKAGLRQYQLVNAERELLENTLHGAVRVLSEILGKVNPRVASSSSLLRDQIRRIAAVLQLPNAWEIEIASMLANVGYVTLPPALMLKSSVRLPLTEAEKVALDRIPEVSSNLVAKIPRLQSVARIILASGWDVAGPGAPAEAASAVPVGARLLRVVRDLDEHLQQGYTCGTALNRMRRKEGAYDPAVLDAAMKALVDPAEPTSLSSQAVTFPAEPELPPSRVRPEPPGLGKVNQPKARRFDDAVCLLVVDEKPAIAAQIQSGLKDTPWVVKGCIHPDEALEQCHRLAPHVVLISLSLSPRLVSDFLQALRAHESMADVPVFAMAVKTALETQVKEHSGTFSGTITKPIHVEDLKAKVARALHLDRSSRYFQQRDGALLITLPPDCSPSVSHEVSSYLRSQFVEAVDAGLNKMVLDFSRVQTADISLIKLGLETFALCAELMLQPRAVGSEGFLRECQKYEETKDWRLAATVDAALAEMSGSESGSGRTEPALLQFSKPPLSA